MRDHDRFAAILGRFRWESLRHAQAHAIAYGSKDGNKRAIMLQMPDKENRFDGTGTNADASLISEFLTKSGKSSKNWIAGHLIAAAFGGLGDDPRNITPLPKTINRQHAAVEGQVRNAHNQLCDFFSQSIVKRYCDSVWALRYRVVAVGVGPFSVDTAAESLHIRLDLCRFKVERDDMGMPYRLSARYDTIDKERVEDEARKLERLIRNQSLAGQWNGSSLSSLNTAPIVVALANDNWRRRIDLGDSDVVGSVPAGCLNSGMPETMARDVFFDESNLAAELFDEEKSVADNLPYDPNDGGPWCRNRR